MKVKRVNANNRKKAFEIVTTRGTYDFPYSRLLLRPSGKDPIREVYPDAEIGGDGFTYRLASGKADTIVLDQVREYARDPEYLRQTLLFKMTITAQKKLKTLGVSKREIMRRMGTKPAQFYRLLDQANTGKTIDQMLKLLTALDCPVDVVFSNAA